MPRLLALLRPLATSALFVGLVVGSGHAEEAAPTTVALRPVKLEAPLDIPPLARRPLGPEAVPAWLGEGAAVEATRTGLKLTSATKRFRRTLLTPKKTQRLNLGTRKAPRELLLFAGPEGYEVGVATAWQGTFGKHRLLFLDTDLDGKVTVGVDCIRWGAGVMRRITSYGLVPIGSASARFTVTPTETGFSATLTPLPAPKGNKLQLACLTACNDVRNRLYGLPPLGLDEAKSLGCQKHATYLFLNNYDFLGPWDGVGSHGEKPEAPGYSEDGARAGRLSTIGGRGDAALTARDQSRTMIHRIAWLGVPDEGLGIGVEARSKNSHVHGYTVVWAPSLPTINEARPPILVPAPGARGVALVVAREHPVPDRLPDVYDHGAGMPISVTLGAWSCKDITLRLYREGAKAAVHAVEGTLFTPQQPISKLRKHNEQSVFFLPTVPLLRDTRYRVVFDATREDGRDTKLHYVWRFETGDK